ncbi:hypothetical protein L484_026235 [Morus notabilis]|uniref:BHLH domain-containing protein n=1 Tax=Morus notabilis TaxID=981085 RepID=W9RUY0_9ROSA|nr:hypothetical protein L484_026235 [Morus notabilis]
MHPPSSTLFPPQFHVLANGSSSVIPLNSSPDHHHVEDPPQSWSQSGNYTGLSGDQEDKLFGQNHFQPKKMEDWEDQMMSNNTTVNPPPRLIPLHNIADDHVKAVNSQKRNNLYGQADHEEIILQQANNIRSFINCGWSQIVPAVSSSPRSCVTSSVGSTTNNNMLDFSYNKSQTTGHHSASSECNSTVTGGAVCKKARVQSSSSQPPLKVRKEKLGDRITALHQLVSPFGKTDTASVLLEAIGYIRFLQSQIEDMEGQEKLKDLRSKGLCLVPVSCTQHVGSDNGADYWAPANYGSGF